MPKAQLWLFLPRYCSALITTAALKAFWGWNPYVQSYRFSGIIHVQHLWQTLIPQEAGGFSRASLSLFSSSYSSPPPPNSNQNNKSIRKNKKKQQNISSVSLVMVCSAIRNVALKVLFIWSYFSLYYNTLSAHLVNAVWNKPDPGS